MMNQPGMLLRLNTKVYMPDKDGVLYLVGDIIDFSQTEYHDYALEHIARSVKFSFGTAKNMIVLTRSKLIRYPAGMTYE